MLKTKLIIMIFICLISSNTFADQKITKDMLLMLLATEAKYVSEKNIDGLMSMISENYYTIVDGKRITKDEYKLDIIKSFMNLDAAREYPELKEFTISDDGDRADILVNMTTKYLITRGDRRFVSTKHSIQKMKLELENDKLVVVGSEERVYK